MKNNKKNESGKRIKALRLKFPLLQNEFARKVNIAYTTFTKIETGVIKSHQFL
jgi:DNA-binding XRE family transcriptional regulator